jgi:hypothetical protein
MQHIYLRTFNFSEVTFQWNDDKVRFVLAQHAQLDFYSAISLKEHSTGRHVAPLGHIILIPSQPFFTIDACRHDKAAILSIVSINICNYSS